MSNTDGEFSGGKVAVITGATKGLGRELSLTFAGAGYEIIGLYRSDSASAKAIESEFKANGYQGLFIKQDITEDGNWREFEEIIKLNGDKHFTLIANACTPFTPKPFHLVDWLEFAEQVNVNVKGTFLIFKKTLPFMIRRRAGNVISVLTSALNPPPKGFAAYVTAKSALEGMTKAIAAEYASKGLRVFSVSPGFMETSLTEGWSEHLKASIYSGNDVYQPSKISLAVFDLTENVNTTGQGEDYSIG